MAERVRRNFVLAELRPHLKCKTCKTGKEKPRHVSTAGRGYVTSPIRPEGLKACWKYR
jgi:hypothetical protein